MKYRRRRSIVLMSFFTFIFTAVKLTHMVVSEHIQKTIETSYVVAGNKDKPIQKYVENNVKDLVSENKEPSSDDDKAATYKKYAISENIQKINPYSGEIPGSKTAYLTFDDGPSHDITPAVLDILKKENVKATFFVIGTMAEKNPEILKRINKEGHTIAKHTFSHDYNYLYSDPINFLEDYKKADSIISSIIGDYNKSLIRFPGGSFGRQAYKKVAEEVGYHYVDWNCLNGDAEGKNYSPKQLVENVKESSMNRQRLVILMHDSSGKENTAKALPGIIHYLKSSKYELKTLN